MFILGDIGSVYFGEIGSVYFRDIGSVYLLGGGVLGVFIYWGGDIRSVYLF